MKKLPALVFTFLLMGPGATVFAQEWNASPPQQEDSDTYSPQELDQLLAPIALYPDQLISPILMASTYPLEVVEAHRWLENPQNAALRDGALTAAMEQQPWDPSVKALVPFPQVLSMMDSNLQWTEELGDAFIAQQDDVMDSIQHLRQMAQASGHLYSTPQETVSSDNGIIVIQPPTPQTVYIPYYNPTVVYGAWPYPGYEPYYFPPPAGYDYYHRNSIAFGNGVVIISALWGWDHWDWRRHHIAIDDHRWRDLDEHHAPPPGDVWRHDPAHRHGVPYHNEAAQAQFGGAARQARIDNFRGYTPHAERHTAPVALTAPAPVQRDVREHERNGFERHEQAAPVAAPAAVQRDMHEQESNRFEHREQAAPVTAPTPVAQPSAMVQPQVTPQTMSQPSFRHERREPDLQTRIYQHRGEQRAVAPQMQTQTPAAQPHAAVPTPVHLERPEHREQQPVASPNRPTLENHGPEHHEEHGHERDHQDAPGPDGNGPGKPQ